MQEIRHIVLIGAGNVGSHLGKAFIEQGLDVVQVFSRTEAHAKALAKTLNTGYTTDLKSIRTDGDLYILAVRDKAIPDILNHKIARGKFLVHTSGTVSMDALRAATKEYGVFYPLQTFSMERNVRFETVPICIEASSGLNLLRLELLAKKISRVVRRVDSDQRKALHLAAVFACNFPNFMYITAEKLINRTRLEFDLLKPLILETAEKVQSMDPQHAQTGPAMRDEKTILEAHMDLLRDQPEVRKLYRELSNQIIALRKFGNDSPNDV